MPVYQRSEGGIASAPSVGRDDVRKPPRPKVLARLPDLDVAELDRVLDSDPADDGQRLLNQRLSMAILVGGGALFLLLALSPLVSNNDSPAQPEAAGWQAASPPVAAPSQPVPAVAPALPAAIAAPPVQQTPEPRQTPRPDTQGNAGAATNAEMVLAAPPAVTPSPAYPTTPFAAGYEAARPQAGYYNGAAAVVAERPTPAASYPSTDAASYGAAPIAPSQQPVHDQPRSSLH